MMIIPPKALFYLNVNTTLNGNSPKTKGILKI